ncbi:hypothetical protein GALL_151110 [mine drainage metagenome]|uniref:Chemotaxis protein n=1 Tax=mine drainage metagenome TaxID=410659 RepID=A0A1J5S3S8_9ZZZZ
MQTTILLSGAIDKLSISFMAVHEAVTKQQQVLDSLMAIHHFKQEEVDLLDNLTKEIGNEVNSAVTAMQFQDMTSQLLTRTIRRVNGLRDLLQELATHGNEMDPSHEHDEIAKFLDDMSHSLHVGSHALSGGLRRSVDQQNMVTGDVDLF